MTSADIVNELRTTRPAAPAALRARVAAIAAREPVPQAGLLQRFTGRRRLFVVVPLASVVAVAALAGLAYDGTRGTPATEALVTGARTDGAGGAAPETALSAQTPGVALDAQGKSATGALADRAQSFAATLTIRVEDAEGVSAAAQRALTVADELGGFVVGSQVATSEEGYAAITMKVPFARAQDAVLRLSRLGTIVAQDVRIQDLQETIDAFDTQIRVTRNQLAAVLAQLARTDLQPAERASLEARRDALREQLRASRAGRVATAAQASLATIQLEVRTDGNAVAAPGGPGIGKTLDRALEVLAWEGAIAAALLIVVAPIALLLALLVGGRRALARRDTERLLEAR